MEKYLTISLMGLLVLGFCATDVGAHTKKFEPPDNYMTFSFVINPLSLGYKHRMAQNTYFTGNMDYIGRDTELILQVGAAYMFPRKFLIFRFFGGGGIEYSRNNSSVYPYIMAGTKLWIFHFDIVHTLQRNSSPGYRLGFIYSF